MSASQNASSPCSGAFPGTALPDESFARAYEALSGAERALLKLCIARLHAVYGEAPAFEARTRRFAQGFGLQEDSSPADWALVLCPALCPSPAALLAAVMPAVFAGLERLLVCFTPPASAPSAASPNAIAAPLLAALELAGIERAFFSSGQELRCWLAQQGHVPGGGRLLCLGQAEEHAPFVLDALAAGADALLLPTAPRYYSMRLDAACEQRFAGPREMPVADSPAFDNEDALQLALDADHEDVWLWPGLSLDWFRRKKVKLYALSGAKGQGNGIF